MKATTKLPDTKPTTLFGNNFNQRHQLSIFNPNPFFQFKLPQANTFQQTRTVNIAPQHKPYCPTPSAPSVPRGTHY